MSKQPKLLFTNANGDVFDHPQLGGVGMKAGHLFRLAPEELIPLPGGSRFYHLPQRAPVGYDPDVGAMSVVGDYSALAVFLPPGYTATYSAAYTEEGNPARLPLFAYAPCVLYKNKYYTAAVKVENERRHDQRFIDMEKVLAGTKDFKKLFPHNRLITHLCDCALIHCCAGAQNFFLKRYEGPLPTSPTCNADCAGCISYQRGKKCPEAQPRIKFTPTPQEIAEIALFHIGNVRDTVVSFGQGCEGEPLLAADTIGKAIRLIRASTSRGVINMNTNASMPKKLERLFDAGLDSIRVSMNSAQEIFYRRYYNPHGYSFKDVVKSIGIAKKRGRFVSLNYLTMPGFTDWKKEHAALESLIEKCRIDMIQWRNLNFDPLDYFRVIRANPDRNKLIGIRQTIGRITRKFPKLLHGYYNPTIRKRSRNLRRSL